MDTNIKIARFWTRILALIIDFTVLGTVGYILGFSTEEYMIRIGSSGILIGLTITVVYFTIFNSKLMNGKTIGKLICKIQVVDINGNTLSVVKAFYRAIILYVPYFFLNSEIFANPGDVILYTIQNFVFFSILSGVIIIYIFNKGNRQSLHDLIIGSYVVSKERNDEFAPLPSIRKSSFYFYGGFIIFLIGISVLMISMSNNVFKDISSTYKKLSEIEGVLGVGVSKNTTTTYFNGPSTTQSFISTLMVTEIPENSSEIEKMQIVKKAINIILNSEPDISKYDIIGINLYKGFDIGIAHMNRTYFIRKSLEEWKELLK